MTIIKCLKHFFSPFHDKKANIHLNFKQKRNAFLWGLGCGIPFVVPGVIAFYASAYFSKKKCTPQSSSDSSDPSDKKASFVFKKTVNPSHDKNDQPLPVDKHQPVVAPDNQPKPLPFGFAELREAETIENVEESLAVILQHNEKDEAFLEKLKSEEPECFGDLLQVAFTLEDFKLLKKLLVFVEPDELEALLEANELIDFELQFPATMENAEKVRQIFGGMEVPDELLEQILTALEEKNEDALEDCLMQAHLESFTDAILKLDLQFSKSYRTNKFLLENRIPFFKTMLNSGFQEASQEKVAIQDQAVSLEAFREALYFTLFDEADINECNYQSLVHIAEVYELPKLTKFCEDWIIENLDELEDISSFAIAYGLARIEVSNHCINPLLQKYCSCKMTAEEEKKLKELLRHCTALDLSNLDSIPEELLFNIIVETANLESIDLSNQPFVSNRTLTTLQENNPNLKRLHFQNCSKKNVLKQLSKYLNLEYLDLSFTKAVSDQFAEKSERFLGSLTKLKILKLNYCKAKETRHYIEDLSFLENMTSLKSLSINGVSFTALDSCFYPFKGLHNLKRLDLNDSFIYHGEFLSYLPQLKIFKNCGIQDVYNYYTDYQYLKELHDIEELAVHLPYWVTRLDFQNLKRLNLFFNNSYVLADLPSLSDGGALQFLTINTASPLSLEQFKQLATDLQSHQDLKSFSFLSHLPKGSMQILITSIPQIRSLKFASMDMKDLQGLSKFDSLKELSFSLDKLTNSHIQKLNAIPNLKILNLKCKETPSPSLLAKLKTCKKVYVKNLIT